VKLQGEFAISILHFVNCCRTVVFVVESKNFVMDLLFMRARTMWVVLPAKVLKKLVKWSTKVWYPWIGPRSL
jgi:hypothetical protein